jgi:hypothetical protein
VSIKSIQITNDGWSPANEGYAPASGIVKKGYQPSTPPGHSPAGNPVTGGYQPVSQQSNPTNNPPTKR